MKTNFSSLITPFCLLLTVAVTPISAQTLFQEPPSAEDYSRYTTAEQCLAAVARLTYEINKSETANWDTMPPGNTWRLTPWPETVRISAAHCRDRKLVLAAPLEDFRWLFELYLVTDRQSDANALLQRRLSELGEQFDSERAQVLKHLVFTYANARPIRLAEADSLWAVVESFPQPIVSGQEKVDGLVKLRNLASELGDTVRAMDLAYRMKTVFTQLSEDEKKSLWTLVFGRLIASENIAFLNFAERMDSLRKSTSAYIAITNAQDQEMAGLLGFNATNPRVGRSVVPIQTDFWFPDRPNTPRPSNGKISVVWPVNERCGQGAREAGFGRCQGMFATLRRIRQRYPSIEITVLSHTVGYFLDQAPPTPKHEAELLRDWLLRDQRIPGYLAVEEMKYLTLPAPDGRTVNMYAEIESMPAFVSSYGKKSPLTDFYTVIDESGTVVWEARRTIWGEAQLYTILDILTHRLK